MPLNSNILDISRRRFLHDLGKAIGGTAIGAAISVPMMGAALAYGRNGDSSLKAGKIFTHWQMQMLKQICALVIPETDTPGAHQVDTHGFIDNQLFNCFSNKVHKEQVQLLNLLKRQVQKRHGTSFVNCSVTDQFSLLAEIDTAQGGFSQKQRKSFKQLKFLIAFGYYTSEVGMTQELRYLAAPGGYQGEHPYKPGDGAWAK